MLGLIVVLALVVGGYYGFLGMVNQNILFTRVPEGYIAIVLRWGKFYDILGPGLHLIGIPGIHTLYSRTMRFYKTVVLPDGNIIAKAYDEEGVSLFKTTQYPYGLPFIAQEDCLSLPLSGTATVNGVIHDYRLAFFEVSDWYAEVNSLVMRVLREGVLANVSFDGSVSPVAIGTGQKTNFKATTTSMLWDALNQPNFIDGLSVVEYAIQRIGFTILSVDIPAIDPPEGWRETTLAPYAARKKKEAAIEEAKASAAAFDDTNQALALWKKEHPNASSDEIMEKQKELEYRAMLKSPSYNKQDVTIRGLENASTAVIGGGGQGAGGTGILVGNQGGGKQGGNSGGKNQGGGKGGNSGGSGGGKGPGGKSGSSGTTFAKGDLEPQRSDYADQASFEADHDAWKQAQI
jgi:regulator of protease activity HflC (stomatin/prohibitin superfamily)